MFPPAIAGAGIVETPIDLLTPGFTFDQRMAEFMENHLRQTVIRIKEFIRADEKGSLTVITCIHLARSINGESQAVSTGNPDDGQRILIEVADGSGAGGIHRIGPIIPQVSVEPRLFKHDDGFQCFKF